MHGSDGWAAQLSCCTAARLLNGNYVVCESWQNCENATCQIPGNDVSYLNSFWWQANSERELKESKGIFPIIMKVGKVRVRKHGVESNRRLPIERKNSFSLRSLSKRESEIAKRGLSLDASALELNELLTFEPFLSLEQVIENCSRCVWFHTYHPIEL